MATKSTPQNNNKIDITCRIGGEAGYGIMTSGLIIGKLFKRLGLHVFSFVEYPSLIRGGHNVFTIRASNEPVSSQRKGVDILIALNEETVALHLEDLKEGGFLISNKDKVDLSKFKIKKSIKVIEIPLISIVNELKGLEVMMNNVAIGAFFALLCSQKSILDSIIDDTFCIKDRGNVCMLNMNCAGKGFNFIKENTDWFNYYNIKPKKDKNFLMTGNDAICLGAIKGGMQFFACYPMTPINSILAFFAKYGPKLGICYFQPEDEISGINSTIGASFAGVKSMVATSGGGFSLMVETYGLAGITETPIVIIEGQRPGPATGLPTWTGQGDARFVLHAAQDDFVRVVLTPGDPKECFDFTQLAFKIAYKYQVPVVVLTDKHLAESYFTINEKEIKKEGIDYDLYSIATKDDIKQDGYKRYRLTKTGVSNRALPGFPEEFVFVANSDEHNEYGFSDEDAENRIQQMEKRMKKIKYIEKEMPKHKIYGNKNSKIGLLSFGSTKGQVLEAQKILKDQRIETSFLNLMYLNPFPTKEVLNFVAGKKKLFLFEQNYSMQLRGLIREKTGIDIENCYNKYDGRQFYPEDIAEFVKKGIKKKI
ncbi:2-oxoglutarate oxidoreductase subunit KorA [bacterium HR34]|nr:2-oxoglutarate oxidoreductase subunit KorA [bacterium HR34]